jgi:catechol 2,3-dioxygenase-like lactoylglutathione lyase family enzyme
MSTGVQLTKSGIDLGIVVTDGPAALAFYRDTLGFRHEGDMPFPGGGTMHRLWCGDSLIKVVVPATPPAARAAGGGIPAATGYRYWTISVANLDELAAACKAKGYTLPVEPRDLRPGIRIAIVEDPDGNWVEFLQTA